MRPSMLPEIDYTAGLALLIFPVAYGGFLIESTVASQAPPQFDATGRPIPTLYGDAMGYLVMGTLLGNVGICSRV